MKVSTRVHYGLRAMTELARSYREDKLLSIAEIARSEGLPLAYLEQLVGELRRSGLVEGTRGVRGGYRLARAPEAITVGEIYRVLEGEVAPVDVAVVDLTFQPGATTGWHVHPGVTLVAVKRGTVTRTLAHGCKRERFQAGQAFVEEPNVVHMVRNKGTVPAETIVTFVVPVGAPPLTPEPAPAGCNP